MEKVCSTILELSESYAGAREAVSYRVIYGAIRAINIMEIAPQEMKESGITGDEELAHLFKVIRLNEKEDIIQAVNRYCSHISVVEKSLQHHYMDVMELVSSLYRFAMNNEILLEDFSGDMGKMYTGLLEMEPEALKKWLVDTSLSFREQLITARNKTTRSLVERAREYVCNHYEDDELSLDSICEELGVSNSYFSTVFKKETGNSFIGYLTDYRMDRASRLLD